MGRTDYRFTDRKANGVPPWTVPMDSSATEEQSIGPRRPLRDAQRPALEVLSGHLPFPTVSVRLDQRNGVLVERYEAAASECVVRHRDALVTVNLGEPFVLAQRCGPKSETRLLASGEFTITPRGAVKSWRHHGRARVLAISLPRSLLDQMCGGPPCGGCGRLELPDEFGARDAELESIARDLDTELDCTRPGASLLVESLATTFAVRLSRRHGLCRPVSTGHPGRLPPPKLQTIIDLMDANLDRPLTLEDLAHSVRMSTFHFARVFKETTGMAPHQFLMSRRIDFAKRLLRDGQLPLADIAVRIGCANQSHFSTLFHRITGTTPARYRGIAQFPLDVPYSIRLECGLQDLPSSPGPTSDISSG